MIVVFSPDWAEAWRQRLSEQGMSAQASGKRSGRGLRIAVQVVGTLAGLGSLAWCLRTALKPESRAQLGKLWDAPAYLIVAMLGLSLVTLALNGLAFWIALFPVKRLRLVDVLATNGICTFLGYLPAKLGAVLRFVIHNRRDKVPIATCGAWFAALAVIMLVNFTIMCATAIHWGKIDAVWVLLTLGSGAAATAVLVGVARVFRGERGLTRMESVVGLTRIEALKKPLRWNIWLQLHAGFEMLSSPGAVAGGLLNRMVDTGVQSARFLVAARILGIELAPQQAMLVSMLYFIVGVFSPSGLAGLREGAVGVWAGSLLSMAGMTGEGADANFNNLGLLVSATEFVSYLIGGALGMLWLRPDRLFRGAKKPQGHGDTEGEENRTGERVNG